MFATVTMTPPVMAEIVIRPTFWHNRARMNRIAQPMDQVMRRIKRAAVSIKPKQPYLDWANSLDEDGVKLGIEFTPEETIYLVDDLAEGELDLETLLEPVTPKNHIQANIKACWQCLLQWTRVYIQSIES